MALTISPGQVVDQDTWGALFTQHGGMSNAQQAVNVSKQPADEGYVPRDKQQPVYQYTLIDGSVVTARTSTDGKGYEIVSYKPSQQFTRAQQQTQRQEQNPPKPRRTETRTEGTPTGQTDANGRPIYDNERPRKVTYDLDTGQLVEVGPLTAAEMDEWRESRERSRNPGGKTDAQIETERKEAETRAARPGTKIRERTEIRDGKKVTVETWRLPDGSTEERVAEEITQPDQVGKPTGNTRARTANGQTVKEIEYILPDGTREWRSQTASDAGNLPIPANAPRYTPDYNADDVGLTAYNNALLQAAAAGIITREQGSQLIEQAAALATQTASHGTTLRSQAQTARGQDITQRGQDINEVASRRSAANGLFENLFGRYDAGAANLMGGEGGLASRAFLAALDLGRSNAQQWGGLQDVPRVPPAYQQAIGGGLPGMGSTQIVLYPGGNVEVSPIGSPAPVVPGAPPAAQNAGAGPGEPPARGNIPPQPVGMGPTFVNPATGGFGIPGFVYPGDQPSPPDGYMGAIRPQFVPDRAALRAQFPDLTDEDLDEVIGEHLMGGAA